MKTDFRGDLHCVLLRISKLLSVILRAWAGTCVDLDQDRRRSSIDAGNQMVDLTHLKSVALNFM
ncbi:hypothetical protein [Nitratireductor sp. XY-223]|uniref:hypothetical protein n=1 Tax=Nitratireductor sp. XY-223 TaxID=2561926 RepID=UPI00145A31D8|nr:hypothetical protein [Nitratireductor sp. XY-223]